MASTPTLQFDRALQQTIAAEPGIRQQMAAGSDFTKMQQPTRQLVAEHAAIGAGDRSLMRTPDAQQFIQQGYVQRGAQQPMAQSQSRGAMTTPRGVQQNIAAGQQQGLSPDALLNAMNRYSTGQPAAASMTYEQTLANELASQQSMIDSINARYASLIDDARDQGIAQKARARAIGNTAGALYSPRTEAEYNNVDDFTNDAIRALEAQKGAEIAAAMGLARSGAFERYQLEAQQAQARSSDYVDNLLSLYGLQQTDRQNAANIALAEAGLTGRYGEAPTLDFLNYQRGLSQDEYDRLSGDRQFGLQQDQLQLQRDEFNRPDYRQFVTLDDGSYGYFDPVAGTVEKLGRALAPMAYGGGGYTSRYGGGGGGGGSSAGGRQDEALLDYYNATGKYPSDANDIETIQRIYDSGIDSYYGGGYSSANLDSQGRPILGPPSPNDVLNYNPFLRGAGAGGGAEDFLSGLGISLDEELPDTDGDGRPG